LVLASALYVAGGVRASAEPTPQISGDLHVNADVERRPLFWTRLA
jgi:hypothetical protein